ncbi:FAD-dependent oxidoreductase, partial [Chloroflexota bacterium]
MKVCIIGSGNGGLTAAVQVRQLNRDVQIDIFSKRADMGCSPCEMPLLIGGVLTNWDELVRGFRRGSFWEKRNVSVHLSTEVTDIDRKGKCIIA